MEMKRVALSRRVLPYCLAREVDVVNPSGERVNRNQTSPREDGTGPPNFDASPAVDQFPAFPKGSCVRRPNSACRGAQHTRCTAGLENAHEAFDEQSAPPADDLG